jgi:glycosyltransferase involved in cell wall biosynthesis
VTRMPVVESRVRVAYFVPPSRHFAGIERVVHELATGLMEAYGDMLDVHVLFSSHYEEDLLRNTPYTLHVLEVDRLRNLASTLRARLADGRYDIVICPQVEATVIAWLVTRGLGIPVFISHLHGNPRVEEHQGTRRTRIAFQLYRHLVSRHLGGVLAVSPSLQRYTAEAVTPHTPVHFVKNPVRDLGAAAPRSAGNGVFRFLNVARLSYQKGQDILLEALALARPDLPPVSLTLVGSGPEEASLRRQCRSLGLDDLVIFAGYASDPTVQFRNADCFVLPSRWEGFGVVLIEALHFGLPLLATDCDFGPSDIITDPKIGELVPPENAPALAEGLKRAAATPPKADQDATRRAIARTYARSEVTPMHFETLQQIAISRLTASPRLAEFVGIGPTGH